jgi:hypothetical protein
MILIDPITSQRAFTIVRKHKPGIHIPRASHTPGNGLAVAMGAQRLDGLRQQRDLVRIVARLVEQSSSEGGS